MWSNQYFINRTLAVLYALGEGGGTSQGYWNCHGLGLYSPRRIGKEEEDRKNISGI